MIVFVSMSLRDRLFRLWPPYARRQDSQLEDAITKLVKDPDAKCIFDCIFTPDMFRNLDGDVSSSSVEGFK